MKNKELNTIKPQVSNHDFETLSGLLNGLTPSETTELLSKKIKTLTRTNDTESVADCVKLNGTVKLLDHHTNRPMEFLLVVPGAANIKERKISVLTPIGIALIGQRKGEQVIWSIGGGKREVTILEVG